VIGHASTSDPAAQRDLPSLDLLKTLAAAWYSDGKGETEREALAALIQQWSRRGASEHPAA
jgi:hypothetical protein